VSEIPDSVSSVGRAVQVPDLERLEKQRLVSVRIELERDGDASAKRQQTDTESTETVATVLQCVIKVQSVCQP